MKKTIRFVIAAVVCVALIVGYYYYLSGKIASRDATDTAGGQLTEVQTIIAKDFVGDYPKTPREVVKWYNRIIKEYYAEEHTDAEITALADQQRMLLDEELLSYNPRDEFLMQVKNDVNNYNVRDQKIISAKICSSNDVSYGTVQGYECAYVTSYYFTRTGNDYSRTFQEYCLRKDANGQWKILTFRLTTGDPEDYA